MHVASRVSSSRALSGGNREVRTMHGQTSPAAQTRSVKLTLHRDIRSGTHPTAGLRALPRPGSLTTKLTPQHATDAQPRSTHTQLNPKLEEWPGTERKGRPRTTDLFTPILSCTDDAADSIGAPEDQLGLPDVH
ncbi:hypothetical protein CONPUDRAFT_158253 [Coniophora puteana RWD-64-598 SS2]|uniref:Uncharacterized protein n=1 Tax=Coniophora puteana (strain RWD-64-598) TaxID=741705 RepID=A0A5M3MC53_CONPW|nr:uncharacterized protein CONPUDRAFT_158253 [Coniophora puteana RWD-64-598 SS2]EIW76225.1 hypothetical protein CONPUDRAFT_158253 [Coniophora puteana RWD-64-598 SS2]